MSGILNKVKGKESGQVLWTEKSTAPVTSPWTNNKTAEEVQATLEFPL